MSKKIILLALAAVSAAVFVLPATAMAAEEDVALHISPVPAGPVPVSGGATSLSNVEGETIDCKEVNGSATFENSTTGHLTLTFSGCFATTVFGNISCNSSGQTSGTIKTTENLPFHLVTAKHASTGAEVPAVLITSLGTEEHFATFACGGFVTDKVTGKGIIGEIENKCGSKSKETFINFAIIKHGEQTYRTVVGTPNTEYDLKGNGATAAQTGTGTVKFTEETTLTCT